MPSPPPRIVEVNYDLGARRQARAFYWATRDGKKPSGLTERHVQDMWAEDEDRERLLFIRDRFKKKPCPIIGVRSGVNPAKFYAFHLERGKSGTFLTAMIPRFHLPKMLDYSPFVTETATMQVCEDLCSKSIHTAFGQWLARTLPAVASACWHLHALPPPRP